MNDDVHANASMFHDATSSTVLQLLASSLVVCVLFPLVIRTRLALAPASTTVIAGRAASSADFNRRAFVAGAGVAAVATVGSSLRAMGCVIGLVPLDAHGLE